MRAGKLRKRISLQAASSTEQDETGQLKKDYTQNLWTTYATVWAQVVESQGQEAVNAKQLVASITHLVIIRYRDDVSPKHRILYGDRRLEIQSVLADERNTQLTLLCQEQGV